MEIRMKTYTAARGITQVQEMRSGRRLENRRQIHLLQQVWITVTKMQRIRRKPKTKLPKDLTVISRPSMPGLTTVTLTATLDKGHTMKAMYFTIDEELPVKVIPDADAQVDGHPVLTYRYTLYRFSPGQDKLTADLDALLSPEKIRHPDYLSTLYFDQPYKAFTYASDGRTNSALNR